MGGLTDPATTRKFAAEADAEEARPTHMVRAAKVLVSRCEAILDF
jgi:hypothetical protein